MIDTAERLSEALRELQVASWMALDTEADSLHAYPEKLCLLQLSHPGGELLVDTLAGLDLGGLLELMTRHRLILHGGDYDLRLMYRTWRFVPTEIFDTMSAARFVGVMRFGLTDLLDRFLGLKLEKGPQKADWGQRPLTPRMIAYAESDARYLKPLQEKLSAELDRLGRTEWHTELCARIVSEAAQWTPPDENLVWRLRGSHALDPLGLAVLRSIWWWREKEARDANRPTFHVLSPDHAVGLAEAAARWGKLPRTLPRHLSSRRANGLARAIEEALALPQSEWPKRIRHEHKRMPLWVGKRVAVLRDHRDRVAADLGLDPSFVASKSQLLELAQAGDPTKTSLMRWQAALLKEPS
ncbi:MAG: ribonuclease D [Limisphaerales bacterium]